MKRIVAAVALAVFILLALLPLPWAYLKIADEDLNSQPGSVE